MLSHSILLEELGQVNEKKTNEEHSKAYNLIQIQHFEWNGTWAIYKYVIEWNGFSSRHKMCYHSNKKGENYEELKQNTETAW